MVEKYLFHGRLIFNKYNKVYTQNNLIDLVKLKNKRKKVYNISTMFFD